MIHPSELVLNLIEVYKIGNGVPMRIGRVAASTIYLKIGSLTEESVGES